MNIIDTFISKGYLQEYHTENDFTIFHFLNIIYVGVVHNSTASTEENDIKGALLTNTEAEIIIKSKAVDAISFLQSKEETSIVFSEKLLARCASAIARFRLKRELQKGHFYSRKTTGTLDIGLNSFPALIGNAAISSLFQEKNEVFLLHKRFLKRTAVVGIFSLFFFFLWMTVMSTDDWREQWDYDRKSVAFNAYSNEEPYSYIELDFLIPFASWDSPDFNNPENSHFETYFLYGNSHTNEYGILQFDDLYEKHLVISDEQEFIYFDEPIILYGEPRDIPNKITTIFEQIQNKTEAPIEQDAIVLPGFTMTMPDGSTVYVPEHTIASEIPNTEVLLPSADPWFTDNSLTAIDQLTKQGISIDFNAGLGTKYIVTTTVPEKIESSLNKAIDSLWSISLFLMFLLFIATVIFGVKTDSAADKIEILNSWKSCNSLLKMLLPVYVKENNIFITADAFKLWCKICADSFTEFACTAFVPLFETTPVIHLYEDNVETRSYTLETTADEDFTGKYFSLSVRLSLHGDPLTPVAQIDGFISDTPEERTMTPNDIGYRMEGHFLACGEERSKLRYEMNRGQDLPMKALKYPGYTTPSNVRLIGICPDCGKSFCFHSYAFYMIQSDVAYSDDGLDCCEIQVYEIDKKHWVYETEGKTFRYYNSFNCPHCGTPYIDYRKYPEKKVFGVSGCVLLGRKHYQYGYDCIPETEMVTPEEFLDDITFIRELQHTSHDPWHHYNILMYAQGYGWDHMKYWADYMAEADLLAISEVTIGSLGAPAKDVTNSYYEHGQKCENVPELNTEMGMLSISGISMTLQAPIKILWFNQSQVLQFFTLVDDELLIKKYAETVIRQTFDTQDAMKLGKPIPDGK